MKRIAVLVAVALVVALVGGCKFGQHPDVEADRASIRGLIERDSVWFNASTTVDSSSGGGYCCAETVFVWWRGKQAHSDPDIQIMVTGDSAWVEWSQENHGDLYSLVKPPDTTWLLWTKTVDETARLRAVFKCDRAETQEGDRGWSLTDITLAIGASNGLGSMHIDSLRIQSASNPNTLIADPLETYFGIDDLISFRPAEAVTLTLYTNAEVGRAFLHTFVLHWPFYVRLEFADLGGGVFQGTWPAQAIPFPRFAIFDLLSTGTIQHPEAAYDFNGWLLPYLITQQ